MKTIPLIRIFLSPVLHTTTQRQLIIVTCCDCPLNGVSKSLCGKLSHDVFNCKMADKPLVLSDVLCFMSNKFGKTDLKSLKLILCDFYTADDLSTAKFKLIEGVDGADLSARRPHIPQRRDGGERLSREVDDLVSLFTFVDEQKCLDKLPMYVTDNPDKMPSLRLLEGDLNYFYKKLDQFDGKIEAYGNAMTAMMTEMRSHLSEWPALCPPSSRTDGCGQQSTAAVTTRPKLSSTIVNRMVGFSHSHNNKRIISSQAGLL